MKKGSPWTHEEFQILRENYATASKTHLKGLLPSRSWEAIGVAARNCLKLTRPKSVADQDKRKSNLAKLLSGTTEAWYWIGFLWADGSMTRPNNGAAYKLTLCITDEDHIRKYAEFIEFRGKIVSEKGRHENWLRQFRIASGDQNVCPLLVKKFGLVERKTYNPPNIPEDLTDDQFDALMIGFIDGDGAISEINGGRSCSVRIENHFSWAKILDAFCRRIYAIAGIEQQTFVQIRSETGFGVSAVAGFGVSWLPVCQALKLRVRELGLPVLERKWRRIDETLPQVPWREQEFLDHQACFKSSPQQSR